jgi:hypothetical protein
VSDHVVGRALALYGADVLDMLGGPLGDEARTARAEVARASTTERAAWRAELATPSVRGVHPSWIEAALEGLPARARAAVASASDPTDLWLARWACASIPPLPPVRSGPVRTLADVLALPAGELEAWLRRVGAAQLQYALSLAQPGAQRKPGMGSARALIARCAGGDPVLVGARSLAPHTSPLAARQLVHRLPRGLGLAVLAELRAHTGDADGSTWDALTSS